MPLPTPKSGEEHDDFMSRCMADDVMNKEYEDEDQRYAVCQSQWDKERNGTPNVERRVMSPEDVELRIVPGTDDSPHMLTGYAARFNKDSLDLGGFIERIQPGAFTTAIKDSDVRGLVNHDPNLLLGRTGSGTLRLIENKRGLKYEIDLPNTQTGKDVAESIRRCDISGCSFAFVVAPGGEVWSDDEGQVTRVLTKINKLLDVGPVTYPAYPDTNVAARMLAELAEEREAKVNTSKDDDIEKEEDALTEIKKKRRRERRKARFNRLSWRTGVPEIT